MSAYRSASDSMADDLERVALHCVSNPTISHDEITTVLAAAAQLRHGRKTLFSVLFPDPFKVHGVRIEGEQLKRLRASEEWLDLTRRLLFPEQSKADQWTAEEVEALRKGNAVPMDFNALKVPR